MQNTQLTYAQLNTDDFTMSKPYNETAARPNQIIKAQKEKHLKHWTVLICHTDSIPRLN